MTKHLPGRGDEATWSAGEALPNDPRTPELEELTADCQLDGNPVQAIYTDEGESIYIMWVKAGDHLFSSEYFSRLALAELSSQITRRFNAYNEE